jgi:hypothetical protein
MAAAALGIPGAARGQASGYGQEPGAAAAPPAPPQVDKSALRALRLRFEREPTVTEVQEAALKFFKVHPERVASYRSRASWKALMPDMEVSGNYQYDSSDLYRYDYLYRNKYVEYGCNPATGPCWPAKDEEDTTRASLGVSVRAHWSLSQLIFNAEVLDVSSLVGVQEGLLREVTSFYFTRRRLMTSMQLNPPQNPNEQITEELRLAEITANLDALTGGFFSREIERRLGGE